MELSERLFAEARVGVVDDTRALGALEQLVAGGRRALGYVHERVLARVCPRVERLAHVRLVIVGAARAQRERLVVLDLELALAIEQPRVVHLGHVAFRRVAHDRLERDVVLARALRQKGVQAELWRLGRCTTTRRAAHCLPFTSFVQCVFFVISK